MSYIPGCVIYTGILHLAVFFFLHFGHSQSFASGLNPVGCFKSTTFASVETSEATTAGVAQRSIAGVAGVSWGRRDGDGFEAR